MDKIIEFVKNSMSGSGNSAVIEGLKLLLGNNFDSLSSLLKNNDLNGFKTLLGNLLSDNKDIKENIEKLANGEDIVDNIKDKVMDKINIGGMNIGGLFGKD